METGYKSDIFITVIFANCQATHSTMMPATTNSDNAIAIFNLTIPFLVELCLLNVDHRFFCTIKTILSFYLVLALPLLFLNWHEIFVQEGGAAPRKNL